MNDSMEYFYNNKRIGTLKDGVFRKRVKKSVHLMKIMDAWAIQYETLEDLDASGCEEVRILETEENRVYSVPFAKLMKEGRVEDFGDGMQVFLPRSQWTITERK